MAESSNPSPQGWQHLASFLQGLTARQRQMLMAAGVAVAVVLGGFIWLLSGTSYSVLYTGLKPADAQVMASRLAAKNIRYELSPDGGTLKVDSDKLDAARVETAAQGLPHNARLGFELFDTPNWAGSDFTEKVNYQRALEGELERTLQTMGEIESVRVHLVMPEDSLFLDQAREAKAAVVVKTHNGGLSDQAEQAIPQLVASAVERLKPENVSVIDADSQRPLGHPRGSGKTTFTEDEGLAQEVIKTLEPVVGTDHVRASVHLEYDLSTSESTEDSYDPKSVIPVVTAKTEEGAMGAPPGGIPGTASNVPGSSAASAAGSGGSDQQSAKSEQAQYVVSRVTRKTSQPAGRLRRITASVLVDDAVDAGAVGAVSDSKDSKDSKDASAKPGLVRRPRTAEELKKIEQLATNVLGIDTARGDLLTIANMSFQVPARTEVPPPSKVDDMLRLVRPWFGLLRQVGIGMLFLLVYLMMLRPIKNQLTMAFRKAATAALPAGASHDASPVLLSGKTTVQNLTHGHSPTPESELDEVKKLVTERIKQEPGEAGKMLVAWMQEPVKEGRR